MHRLSKKDIRLFFGLFVFAGILLMFSSSKAGAIPGAPSNFYPEVNTNGLRDVYAITQIVSTSEENWDTKMKARTTTAMIYVPESRLNQTIEVTIIHGCDGAGARDGNWWNGAQTVFDADGGSPIDSKSCGASLDKNITYTFTSVSMTGRRLVEYGGVRYHVHMLRANAQGVETGALSLRYTNTFQLSAITPDVLIGLSYIPIPCDIINYPRSCPPSNLAPPDQENGTPYATESYSYSSFYGSTTPNSMKVDLSFGCNGGKGQLLVYDLDAKDASLGQDLGLVIRENGVDIGNEQNDDVIWIIGGANNGVLKLPINDFPTPGNPRGYPHFNFSSNSDYTLQIDGLSSDNAFQILPNFYPGSSCAGPIPTEPIGFIDSCIVSGRNVVLYGWAYDNDGGGAQPQVSVTATGQTAQLVNSSDDYRSGDINTFLDGSNSGNATRDNRYGFQVTYSGMTKGNTYSVSGTVLNFGAGSNKTLGINVESGFPTNGISGSSGFPGNTIPDACLPPAVVLPTCEATGGTYIGGVSARFTTATATNYNTDEMSVSKAAYVIRDSSGTQIISGSDTSDLNIPAKTGTVNGSRDYDGENSGKLSAAGTYTAEWSIDWSLGGVSRTMICEKDITIIAPPECSAKGGKYFIGVSSKLTTASATNMNTNGEMTITSARYVIKDSAGSQITSGSDTSDLNIPAKTGTVNGSRDYDGENHIISTDGEYQAEWTLDWSTSGVSGTITCATPAAVECAAGNPTCPKEPCKTGAPECPDKPPCFEGDPLCPTPPPPVLECGDNPLVLEICYQAPTCVVPPPTVIGDVGLPFVARTTIDNPNPVDLPVDYVVYKISGAYIGPQNRIGSVSGPNSIGADADKEYNFSDDVAKDRPTKIAGGADNSHTVTWTVKYKGGGIITCDSAVTIVVMPPTCSAVQTAAGTGSTFSPRVGVTNPNGAVDMKMNAISYSINPGNYTGTVEPVERTDAPPGITKTYTASTTSIPTPGEYTTTWTVTWEVSPMSQTIDDCGASTPDTIISNQPYARFYGNDLFAGGGFGENCTTTGFYDALGYGTNSTHDTYLGTASELAIFAVGRIENVLPGAQRNRDYVQELAFANTDINTSTGIFGGGFGSVMCSPDYYSKVSSAVGPLADDPSGIKDLSSLASGSYLYGSGEGTTTVLTTGAGIVDGRRVVIYVDGDAQITDAAGRFGYANVDGTWPSFSDIPSLYVIASGNIYVDADVTTMDGVYVAQPRPSGSVEETGQIYSCSRNADDPLTDLNIRTAGVGANAEFILNECDNKLTVNGSFMAAKVHLLRSIGTVVQGKPYETYKDANNIAEIFRFSPELYLIEGGGLPPRSTNAKIDSIVALPPAF